MKFNFNENEIAFLKIIAKNAQMLGKRVFFVGGIVRDNLLGNLTKDIDLLLLGNAIEFSNTLPDEIQFNSIHEDFCTLKVQYKNIQADIASSRTEIYPNSGCLPVLDEIGVSLEKDAQRRDFKVNALYCELKIDNDELNFELVDLVDGVSDLKNKTLNVLHDNSYIDDPTRILRGLNFKHRFGFDFSSHDKKLIDEYLLKIDYSSMSLDRNSKVLKEILSNDFQDDIFREIIEKKYYKIIHSDTINVDFLLLEKTLKFFNLKNEEKTQLYLNILHNVSLEKICTNDILEIYRTFEKFSKLDLAYYYCKTQDENVLLYLEISNIKLLINGHDLINLGYKQGSEIGKILDFVLREKLLNPKKIIDKNDEINLVSTKFKTLT